MRRKKAGRVHRTYPALTGDPLPHEDLVRIANGNPGAKRSLPDPPPSVALVTVAWTLTPVLGLIAASKKPDILELSRSRTF